MSLFCKKIMMQGVFHLKARFLSSKHFTMKTEANAASAAKVPPAPLLPTYCGHCDLDNEHKSTASLGGQEEGGA